MRLQRRVVWVMVVQAGVALIGVGGPVLAETPQRGGRLVLIRMPFSSIVSFAATVG